LNDPALDHRCMRERARNDDQVAGRKFVDSEFDEGECEPKTGMRVQQAGESLHFPPDTVSRNHDHDLATSEVRADGINELRFVDCSLREKVNQPLGPLATACAAPCKLTEDSQTRARFQSLGCTKGIYG
jgi:hypothetical protein